MKKSFILMLLFIVSGVYADNVIVKDKTVLTTSGTAKYVKRETAGNNAELRNKYNPDVKFNLKPRNSKAHNSFPIMGMAPSSILANDEVEMNFVKKVVWNYYHNAYCLRYYIEITNKTDSIIYVDKGNSYRLVAGIKSMFFDMEFFRMSSAIAPVSSTPEPFCHLRYLPIPPHSSAYISECRWGYNADNKWTQLDEAEYYYIPDGNGQPLKSGHYLEYGPDNTPHSKFQYVITYSTSPDFKTYSSLDASLYVRYVVASGIFKKQFKYKSGNIRCGAVPNFESEPSMIIGMSGWNMI